MPGLKHPRNTYVRKMDMFLLYYAPLVWNENPYTQNINSSLEHECICLQVFARSAGSVLLQRGDKEECEMFAWKVCLP